jgi:hypothetical protein
MQNSPKRIMIAVYDAESPIAYEVVVLKASPAM